MVVIAYRPDLGNERHAARLYRFLDRFRRSKGKIVEAKSLGPFQWDSRDDFIGLLDLSALLVTEADKIEADLGTPAGRRVVGIDRRLEVHRDFFDVVFKVEPDLARRRKALLNFCAVLKYELDRMDKAASVKSEIDAKAGILQEARQKVQGVSAETSRALGSLEKDHDVPYMREEDFDSAFQKILTTCHQAREFERSLRNSFEAVESLARERVATLDKRERQGSP